MGALNSDTAAPFDLAITPSPLTSPSVALGATPSTLEHPEHHHNVQQNPEDERPRGRCAVREQQNCIGMTTPTPWRRSSNATSNGLQATQWQRWSRWMPLSGVHSVHGAVHARHGRPEAHSGIAR